MNMKTKCLD